MCRGRGNDPEDVQVRPRELSEHRSDLNVIGDHDSTDVPSVRVLYLSIDFLSVFVWTDVSDFICGLGSCACDSVQVSVVLVNPFILEWVVFFRTAVPPSLSPREYTTTSLVLHPGGGGLVVPPRSLRCLP